MDAKNLLQQLLWPAAAGNVAWSFFALAIGADWREWNIPWARLFALLCLSVYLAIDWHQTSEIESKERLRYWLGDGALLFTIVIFAIATATEYPGPSSTVCPPTPADAWWLQWLLVAIFGVAVLGHLAGIWERSENTKTSSERWRDRRILAGVNALGLVVLGGSHLLYFILLHYWPDMASTKPFPSNLAIALGVVVVVWIYVRKDKMIGKS